jgi:MraZ protein
MTDGEEFWGIFDLTLDDRARLAVPARYRHLFERGGRLVQGLDGQVELWTVDGYKASSAEFTAESMATRGGRRLRRQRYAPAWEVELDRQGRILVPIKLREKNALDGVVVVCGRGECLEIWNPQRWEAEEGQWDNEGEGR